MTLFSFSCWTTIFTTVGLSHQYKHSNLFRALALARVIYVPCSTSCRVLLTAKCLVLGNVHVVPCPLSLVSIGGQHHANRLELSGSCPGLGVRHKRVLAYPVLLSTPLHGILLLKINSPILYRYITSTNNAACKDEY